jgi:hypothetical protein
MNGEYIRETDFLAKLGKILYYLDAERKQTAKISEHLFHSELLIFSILFM